MSKPTKNSVPHIIDRKKSYMRSKSFDTMSTLAKAMTSSQNLPGMLSMVVNGKNLIRLYFQVIHLKQLGPFMMKSNMYLMLMVLKNLKNVSKIMLKSTNLIKTLNIELLSKIIK